MCPLKLTLPDNALEQGLQNLRTKRSKSESFRKGNSLTVNQIKNSDIQVVAQEVSSVSGAGGIYI